MQVRKDYVCSLSVSEEKINSKSYYNSPIFKLMENVTLPFVLSLLTSCYSLIGIFRNRIVDYRNGDKSILNFKGIPCVVIQIKDSSLKMKEFISVLSYQPTLGVYEMNKFKNGFYNFKLLYFFDKNITSNYVYKELHRMILEKNKINPKHVERGSAVNFIGGTDCNVSYKSDIIYSMEDFDKISYASKEYAKERDGRKLRDELEILSKDSEMVRRYFNCDASLIYDVIDNSQSNQEEFSFHPNGNCGSVEVDDDYIFGLRCNHLMWMEGNCEGNEEFWKNEDGGETIEDSFPSILVQGNHKGVFCTNIIAFHKKKKK